MPVPVPLTQPNQSIMLPTRTCSQVTSEQTNKQSESPSQELTHLTRAGQQLIIKPSNHSPTKVIKSQSQPKSRFGPPLSAKKKLQWGDSEPQPKQVSQSHNHPGFCVMNKVETKPEEEWWKVANREQSPCKREAPPPLPTSKTEHSRSCPQQNLKKREILNCDKLGGPAECQEENPVDNMTIKHSANQCCVHFASCRIDCETETKLSCDTMIDCLNELDELSQHQFAQVFKVEVEKNPDIPLCEEVQRDCDNLKE